MIKALVYLRVSTAVQSVERQKADLQDFIKSKGFNVDEVYYHYKEGASAYKIDEDYLELKEGMYKYLKENTDCKTVFAWHINRLGRDEVQLQEIRRFLVNNKVQLFIKEPSLYLLNDDGTENGGMSLAFSLFATMSRLQIQELKAKTSSAKRLNAQKGKYNGGEIKFGYTVDNTSYVVPDNNNSELVKICFMEYSTGRYSCKTLADELNARGYTYDGKPLERRMINRILKDTAYIGYTIDKDGGTRREYIPIISEELFTKVSDLLDAANKVQNMESVHHYFASKLIVCPDCGRHWTANHLNYRCSFHYGDNKECGCADTFKISVLDGILYDITNMLHADRITKDSNEVKDDIKRQMDINTSKMKLIMKKIDGIKTLKEKVQKGWENGVYDDLSYDKRMQEIKADSVSWKNDIKKLEEENINLNKQLDFSYNMADKLLSNFESFEAKSDSEVQRLVRTYIKAVRIGGTKTEKTIDIETYQGKIWKYVYYPFRKKDRLYKVVGKKLILAKKFKEYKRSK